MHAGNCLAWDLIKGILYSVARNAQFEEECPEQRK